MDYSCKRCGYNTDRLSNLKIHLKSKHGCNDTLGCGLSEETLLSGLHDRNSDRDQGKYLCGYCGTHYKTVTGRNRHQSKCNANDEINKLRAEVTKLKAENEILKGNPPITHHNTINTTNNITDNSVNINTITVVLRNFGDEDIEHVKNDTDFLDRCLKELPTAVRNVVEKIYYDKDHPENKTILMKSLKANHVMIHQDGAWKLRHISETIPKMVKTGRNILRDHYVTTEAHEKIRNEGEVDLKISYFDDLALPNTMPSKNTASQVKSVVGNYMFIKPTTEENPDDFS